MSPWAIRTVIQLPHGPQRVGGGLTIDLGMALGATAIAVLAAAGGVAVTAVALALLASLGPLAYAYRSQPARHLQGE